MNNQQGFTLIEMLIVLGISFTIIGVGTSVQVSLLDHYREEKFFELFQNDVLYMQQMTIVTEDSIYMTIDPANSFYAIKKRGLGQTILKRNIPDDWDVQIQSLHLPIDFGFDGIIKNPGMFSIKTNNKNYFIYFPFGLGRSYIIEE